MNKKIILVFIFIFLQFVINKTFASADPLIDGVDGNIMEGSSIIIRGSNFGDNGPNIILFDDFARGIEGEEINLNATIGDWSGLNQYYIPHYAKDGDGNMAGELISDNVMRQLNINFDPVQEIFISYRVMIPSGKHFPYSFAPNTFPSGSQWKLTWLMDGERGYMGNDDICLPTWGNGTYFIIGGNDNAFQANVGWPETETNWFSFSGWNRFSVYLKGGVIPDVDPGIAWVQGLSFEFGQKQFLSNPVIFDGDDAPDAYEFSDDDISQWNRFNVPGWQRSGDVDAVALYDDIYVATGQNAAARIEIGNNATYNDCTKLSIITSDIWSDKEIKATIRLNSFEIDEILYLFVFNSNNDHNLVGYLVNIEQEGPVFIRSDVNQDSQINVVDSMLIFRYSLGLDMASTTWQELSTTGDVNCDNISNLTDALLTLRYSLGLDMDETDWCEDR